MNETTSSYGPALTLDVLAKAMKACEAPWDKYRRQYELHRSEYLSQETPVLVLDSEFGKSVVIRERTYKAIQQMDWGAFGPPKDDELAAMLAHAVLSKQEPKLGILPRPVPKNSYLCAVVTKDMA